MRTPKKAVTASTHPLPPAAKHPVAKTTKNAPHPFSFSEPPKSAKTVPLPSGVKLEMLRVEPGNFLMGSPASERGRNDDEPQHPVLISRTFWLGKYPVTQHQWEAVMGTNPSTFKGPNRPVENVTWDEAAAFCKKINELTKGKRPAGYEYALPTETEWEYACRAGTTSAYSFGSTLSKSQANCKDEDLHNAPEKGTPTGQTNEVGTYPPNAWGFYDMHGNVWEWCHDWYGEYPIENVVDPTGALAGSFRVNRGGSWFRVARICRSAFRDSNTPHSRYSSLGFRLALSPAVRE
ncbi:MAG: formylglycine-generating enzyme family protein [Puniceicoccales bacterium]|jgi:formylglycine-generating enzyme required for sulfatase activity|nr:formylglycine-generating enzyme family protein [Puniceicoccales bacterium]